MSFGASPSMTSYPYGFSNGVSVRNVPLAQMQSGQIFWVYNGTVLSPTGRPGSNSNRGTFDSPMSSIAGAIALCKAGRGDTIMVKAGHSETVNASTLLDLSIAGVSVIGLGNGAQRATVTVAGSTAATITVSAANVLLRNLLLDFTGIDAIAAGLTVNASGFNLVDCLVRVGSASAQATLGVSVATGLTGCVFSGNRFLAAIGTAGTTAALQIVGGSEHIISDNQFIGDFTAGTGAISNITTASANLTIARNYLNNTTATSTKVITCVAGTTGQISDNRMQILSGTAPITAAGMSWVGGNYYAATVATAGTLI